MPMRRRRCAAPSGWTDKETKRMKRQDFRFFHRLRVRWAEVDMQKIVLTRTT